MRLEKTKNRKLVEKQMTKYRKMRLCVSGVCLTIQFDKLIRQLCSVTNTHGHLQQRKSILYGDVNLHAYT